MSSTCEAHQDLQQKISKFYLQSQYQLLSKFKGRRPRVIVISGPTATGKTELAITLAKVLGGEIISADSMQVYEGMDIGTAKATKEQQEDVPHHLIDVCKLTTLFNVSEYFEQAHMACRSVLARGAVPIIVGGTGFYMHAFLYGPPSGPPSVPEVRCALEEEMKVLGTEEMYERVCKIDPIYCKSITHKDKHKIIRALEVYALTGQPISAFSWHDREHPLYYDYRCFFAHRPRGLLYDRINKRCVEMIENGLVDEVKNLLEVGLLENPSAAMAIGYKQTIDFLNSNQSDEDFEKYLDKFQQASRRYAKRQFTWFRKEAIFEWLNVEENSKDECLKRIIEDYMS